MQITDRPSLEQIPLPHFASIAVREFNSAAFRSPWHQHPEMELTWILKGSGLRYVGDSVEPFHEGDFCLLGGNLPHTWLSTEHAGERGVRSFVIQFDPLRWGNELLRLPEFARISNLFEHAGRGLKFQPNFAAKLRRKFLRARAGLGHFTGLIEILEELATNLSTNTQTLAAWSPKTQRAADARLRTVFTLLSERAGGSISQAEVARQVGLTPAAFSRFFRRFVGRTFQSYLSDMRLSEVCRQLLESNRTISEIAFHAGFGNLSNFNRAFRAARGMTPGKFRELSLSRGQA